MSSVRTSRLLDAILDHEPIPETISLVRCVECHRQLDDEGRHISRGRDWKLVATAEAERALEKARSGTWTYAGAIASCQALVSSADRSASFRRCSKRPRWVRQVSAWGGPEWIVVCGSHRTTPATQRDRGDTDPWRRRPPADEPIESRYLPHPFTTDADHDPLCSLCDAYEPGPIHSIES